MRFALRRRKLGQLMIISTVGATIANFVEKGVAQTQVKKTTPMVATSTSEIVKVTLQVNGTPHSLQIEPRVTLLDALREYIGLMVLKKVAIMVSVVLVRCWLMGNALIRA